MLVLKAQIVFKTVLHCLNLPPSTFPAVTCPGPALVEVTVQDVFSIRIVRIIGFCEKASSLMTT